MTKIRLYLDEDVDENLAPILRRDGFDIITTNEAGNKGKEDIEQIEFAISQGRAILTHNVR